jgi:signal transduction histidine kinase
MQVKTILPNDLPSIISDRKIIKIIFQNLLSNAIKYSPAGKKITIDISEDKIKKMVNINVSDQGYGIPMDQHSRVFEKLFRADNIKEKNIEGTGLGLYLVKIIIEKIGGSIRFDSQEGIGTTFQVSLPLKGQINK